MTKAAQSSFFRRFVHRAPESAHDDPADLGTAFGLDLSLGPADAQDENDDRRTDGTPQSEHTPMAWLSQRRKAKR